MTALPDPNSLRLTCISAEADHLTFAAATRFPKLESDEEALAYYHEEVEEPIAKDIGEFHEQRLREAVIDPPEVGVDLREEPGQVL